jgi:putative oxygen-independent coproporphyrinogen III oxidase
VFSLDSMLRAQEAMLAVSRLSARRHLDLEDAAIVSLNRGRVRLTQTRDINPAQGAVGGAWLGTIAGLFAGLPLVGAALGAAAGGMYARLRDFGIDDRAMKEFGRTLEGERAALFLLVRDCHRMRALHEVSRFPARLERSSADPDLVELVRGRLAARPVGRLSDDGCGWWSGPAGGSASGPTRLDRRSATPGLADRTARVRVGGRLRRLPPRPVLPSPLRLLRLRDRGGRRARDDDRDLLMGRYVRALAQDLAAQAAVGDWPKVTSVFVGGGTPTLLAPEAIASVVRSVGAVLDLATDVEVTVECNPETASAELFAALADAGVTRVSMGAQSFDPAVLAVLDRLHRPERIAQAVAMVRAAGIAEVSLDLIYGTPGEDAASWRSSLAEVLAAGVDHVSAYALGVHANTPLGRAVAAGQVPAPDDDVQRDRFDEARAVLRAAGFVHYEVANFARGDARRSRHNVLYWRHGDYLGVGVGAHAHRDGRRWWTTRSTVRYLEGIEQGASDVAARRARPRAGVTGEEALDEEARALERLLLGLRLVEGLHPFDVPAIDPGVLEEVVALDLVSTSCGRVQATGSRLVPARRDRPAARRRLGPADGSGDGSGDPAQATAQTDGSGSAVGERPAHQTVMTVGQLGGPRSTDSLVRGQPGELERVLRRTALTVDGDDEAQRDRMLARVVEAAA